MTLKLKTEKKYKIQSGELLKFPKIHPSQQKPLEYEADPKVYKHRGYGPTTERLQTEESNQGFARFDPR
jgi:hypothetical protein